MTGMSFCSPAKPWGLHPSIEDNLCPRCGWTAREAAEPEVQDGDPPLRGAEPAAP
jgi:hypothetical protein